MKRTIYLMNLSGISLGFQFRYPDALQYFGNYLSLSPVFEKNIPKVCLSDEEWNRYSNLMEEKIPGAYTEYSLLCFAASSALLPYQRCAFHGVAFLLRKKAWLITGKSGVGKTTQLHNWQKLYGNEFEVINGDKPILECRADETVWIYPSPWNGKENYQGNSIGQLAGIIYLEQAKCNRIERLTIRDAMMPIYNQFLYFANTVEDIKGVGKLQDILLRNIPVWKLSNLGDEASTKMAYDTITEYAGGANDKI